jgi:membrane protein
MSLNTTWKIIKQSFHDFFESNVLKLSGALAFFTIFSLPGLLIIIIWFSDFFYGKDIVEASVYKQIGGFVGDHAATDLKETIHNATMQSGNHITTIIGLAILLIGATSVFSEIQDSINYIWKLKAKPRKGWAWLKIIINRLLSFSMIIALGFILLVSLVINGVMELLINNFMQQLPQFTSIVVNILNILLTFFITAFIFGAIFKVLPDARIKWRHVQTGSMVTALLFMGGKFLIGYYLGHSRITTAYGTTGSLIIVLVWVYYSAIILYYGAAFTHAYALQLGSRIYPNNYAVWVQQIEVESERSIQQQPEQKTVIEVPQPPQEPSASKE